MGFHEDPFAFFTEFFIEETWAEQIQLILCLLVGPLIPAIIFLSGFPQGPRSSVPRIIEKIVIYPIKGAKGIEVDEVRLFRHGFEGDRTYILVNPDADPSVRECHVNAREWPAVNQIEIVKFDLIKSQEIFSANNINSSPLLNGDPRKERLPLNGIDLRVPDSSDKVLHVPFRNNEKDILRLNIWGEDCIGYDQGDEVADYLTKFIKKWHKNSEHCPRVRLVYFAERSSIKTREEYWAPNTKSIETRFHDNFPVLVTSTKTMKTLHKKLGLLENIDQSVRRFRANLVIDSERDDMRDYEEDYYHEIQISGESTILPNKTAMASIIPAKLCHRCALVQVNPNNGTRDKTRILTELRNIGRDAGTMLGSKWIPHCLRISPSALLSVSDTSTARPTAMLGKARIWVWKNLPFTFLYMGKIHIDFFHMIQSDKPNTASIRFDPKATMVGMNCNVEIPFGPIIIKKGSSTARVKFV